MSRELFGAMGALLDERELALTLAAIGVVHQRMDVGTGLAALLAAKDSGFAERTMQEYGRIVEVPVRLRALQAWIVDSRKWQENNAAPMPWQAVRSQFQTLVGAGNRLRFRIDVAGASDNADVRIDVPWLARMLGTPALDALGVYVARPVEARALEWNWPLRIGVPSAVRGAQFRASLDGAPYRELYDFVDDAPCDLMLLPVGLRDAKRVVEGLDARASAVIVVGGTTDGTRDTQAMLLAIRDRVRAAAVALANVPAQERAPWFVAFIAETAHNGTFDMAVMRASRREWRTRFSVPSFADDLTPPLVEADRSFVAQAVVEDVARRIARAASALPQADTPAGLDRSFSNTPVAPADTIKVIADRLAATPQAWHHETGDSARLAQFRRRVEEVAGQPLGVSPLQVGAPMMRAARAAPPAPPPPAAPAPAAPPPAAAAPVERAVLVDLFVQSAAGGWASADKKVAVESTYALDTFIGMPREGVVDAGAPLPERTLPPSADGHDLTLAFTPLWRGADGEFAAAQTKRIHLPQAGDSLHATFYFKSPATLEQFRARLVVLFGFRVLQTLILDAPGGALRLEVETRVSADFGERSLAPPFEAALVVNHNPLGASGIAAVGPDGAAFIEPVGLDVLVGKVRKQLEALNLTEEAPELGNADVDAMLRTLAMHGAELTRTLKRQPQLAGILGVRRLQVVDAREGAYLPIEFFYDGTAPLPTATRCENATAALENLDVHAQCPHNRDRDANFHCPAAFWGFSRCLERQPFGGVGFTVFRQPTPGANTLKPLEKALFAASKKVRSEDLDAPAGVEGILTHAAGAVSRACSWDEWQTRITTESPSLLVLIPHSLEHPQAAGEPALEISGTNLACANVNEHYVSLDPQRTPVVLLLGCSTALPDVPFLNAVAHFKDSGAALVIGTIATIRGRQVGAFVRALLGEMRSAAAGGGTFDEVFLRVKQRLLAGGDPFVLSLLAYGDSGWRIQA